MPKRLRPRPQPLNPKVVDLVYALQEDNLRLHAPLDLELDLAAPGSPGLPKPSGTENGASVRAPSGEPSGSVSSKKNDSASPRPPAPPIS